MVGPSSDLSSSHQISISFFLQHIELTHLSQERQFKVLSALFKAGVLDVWEMGRLLHQIQMRLLLIR